MADKNKYIDMSAREALKLAKDRYLLLPDIQREYVWGMRDIEKLFDSIVDGYPIGSCIFWKTNKKVINESKPNLYYFLREYKQWTTKNEKAPELFGEEGDYYIVLDGQQRITSLNIAFYGSYTSFKGGRGHAASNPKYWITRELYYNLDFYKEDQDPMRDDEHPPKRFMFLSETEAKKGNYYKIKNLLAFDDTNALLRELIRSDFDTQIQDDLTNLYGRTLSSNSDGLIHYYCVSENTYDEALDIFVRVNSTGRKLSKSDLLFSTLIDGWKNGKESIDKLLEYVNYQGEHFSFTRDYLMRLMLVLVDAPTNLKIESFDRNSVANIRSNWDNISNALKKMVSVLVSMGMSDAFLSSYNATMPIVYYLYKGGRIEGDDDLNEAKKFLHVSMAKGLFGVASNEALRSTRKALAETDCKKAQFSLTLFKDVILTGNRSFIPAESDIDYWLDNYLIGQNTYIILSLLYPELKLDQVTFHQDHCHPHALFEKSQIKPLGLSDEKIAEWQVKRNKIANLQLLEGRENESKNKTPLKQWIEDGGKTIKFLPAGISLELSAFDEFYEARRALIKKELMSIFGI